LHLPRNPQVLLCRVAGKLVSVPPSRLLPGSDVPEHGPATIVLTREVATVLGLP